jgi:hypothetical protein
VSNKGLGPFGNLGIAQISLDTPHVDMYDSHTTE